MSLTLKKSKVATKIGCHVIKYGLKSELDIKEVTACYVCKGRLQWNKLDIKEVLASNVDLFSCYMYILK